MLREELPPVEARGQRVEAGRDVAAGSIGGRRKHRSILARAPPDRSLREEALHRKGYIDQHCPRSTNQLITQGGNQLTSAQRSAQHTYGVWAVRGGRRTGGGWRQGCAENKIHNSALQAYLL